MDDWQGRHRAVRTEVMPEIEQPYEPAVNRTHDLTDAFLDCSITVLPTGADGVPRARLTCWRGATPGVGDFVLLPSRDGRDVRYWVSRLDLAMDQDPPTMWIATLRFAPR